MAPDLRLRQHKFLLVPYQVNFPLEPQREATFLKQPLKHPFFNPSLVKQESIWEEKQISNDQKNNTAFTKNFYEN